MFERVGRMAAQMATSVSRRQFLRRFGGSAMTLAAAVGGMLSLPAVSLGDKRPFVCPEGSYWRCVGQAEGFPCDFDSVCKRSKHSNLCECYSRSGNHC